MTLDALGRPAVVYQPCEQENVSRLMVEGLVRRQTEDSQGSLVDSSTVWDVRAEDGKPISTVTLGEVPEGFYEESPFRDYPELQGYRITVDTDDGEAHGGFEAATLSRVGILDWEGEYVQPRDFESVSLSLCDGELRSP